ncbi:MAG TPA: hypothetical protein PKV97_01755 [Thauera aminoaromatica]|nr:hypothetical protein [Thauera aminoaromatica]
MQKRISERRHAQRRGLQRAGIWYDGNDLAEMERMIRAGQFIEAHRDTNTRSIITLIFRERTHRVVYSKNTKQIITFLDGLKPRQAESTALQAFKILLADSALLASNSIDGSALKWSYIASSLELITMLPFPVFFEAGHVLAGMRAQKNETCDALAAMLEERQIKPLGGARDLWAHIVRVARRAANEAEDKALSRRLMNVSEVYRSGMENLDE